MTITIKEMYEKMNEDTSMNYIGRCITLLQANGIDLSQKILMDRNIILKGYSLLIAHPKTGRKVNAESFLKLNPDITICNYEYEKISFFTRIKAMIYAILSSRKSKPQKRIIYLAWTNVLYEWLYYFEKNVKDVQVNFIILDDGEGSYADTFKDMLNMEVANNSKRSYILSTCKIWLKYRYFLKLYNNLLKNNRITDNRLFCLNEIKGKFLCSRKEELIEKYIWVLRQKTLSISNSVLDLFSNAVVIATQCYTENNFISNNEDFYTYQKVINALKDSYNLNIIIKPHPRELNIDKYADLGCSLYNDTKYPMDSIFANLDKKPYCLISINSSTLLNAHGIFDIPSISIAKIMLNDKSLGLGYTLRSCLENYVSRYENIIYMPDTYNELINIIGKIIDGDI